MAKFTPAPNKAPAPAPVSNASKNTPARNTALPKSEPRQISHEMIAKRAYEIYISGKGGSQHDNWMRAERELKGV